MVIVQRCGKSTSMPMAECRQYDREVMAAKSPCIVQRLSRSGTIGSKGSEALHVLVQFLMQTDATQVLRYDDATGVH